MTTEAQETGSDMTDAEPDVEAGTPEPEPESKPRRVLLPNSPSAGLNLQFVSAPEKKPAPKPKPSPWEARAVTAGEDFEREAAALADSITWTLERVGPHYWNGEAVDNGTFPSEFTGPAKASTIGEIAGGGTYYVRYTDPKTGSTRKLGPIKVMGPPKSFASEESLDDRNKNRGPTLDWRVASAPPNPEDDTWVGVYDPRSGGWVKKRKIDIEREAARTMTVDPAIEAMKAQIAAQAAESRRATDEMAKAIGALAQSMQAQQQAALLAANAAPKEDPAAKWLEIERIRLNAEKESKTAELAYLREKLDKEAAALQLKLEHEREVAERKVEAEKERAQAEKAALEAKLDAERERLREDREAAERRAADATRLSEERAQKAHEAMMAMVKDQRDPMERIGGLLSLFRDFSDIANPQQETDGDKPPQSRLDKLIDVMASAGKSLAPALAPAVERAVNGYMNAHMPGQQQPPPHVEVRQIQQQPPPPPPPQRNHTPPPPQPKAPARKEAPPVAAQAPAAPAHTPEEEEAAISGVGLLLAGVLSAMEAGSSPTEAWQKVATDFPLYSLQFLAYDDVEKMLVDLKGLTADASFKAYNKQIERLIALVNGNRRDWANAFLRAAKSSNS